MYENVFGSPLGFFAPPIIAIITMVATVYGLTKHRSRSNLWWIITCAVISVFALVITGISIYYVLDYLVLQRRIKRPVVTMHVHAAGGGAA